MIGKKTLFLFWILAAFTLRSGTARNNQDGIPVWLAESETYGFAPTWEEIDGTAWKFVTHVPHTGEFLGMARARGIRTFPYMTFYQLPLNDASQEIRLSEHPDWILVNRKGQWAKTGFWESEDAKNIYCTCPNVAGYADAVLAYLDTLMKRGASGIFLDNVHPNRECWGEKFGNHKHLFKTQIEAFADLMRRARELIRKHNPEGALLINSANPATLPLEFWLHTDAEMSESYICTWVSEKRWGDWNKDWNGLDRKVPAGKQVCCLSYVGSTKNPVKDDIFFCYASARLMNFIWNAGGSPAARKDPAARKLYAITLGKPVTDEIVQNGLHYRRFEYGMVAVNPTSQGQILRVEGDLPTSFLHDLYEEKDIPVGAKEIRLTVPAQSGRAWIFKPKQEYTHLQQGGTSKAVLLVRTEPGLGKTEFRIDGMPMFTYAGRWTTVYEKGENYGNFYVTFDKPGWHTVEIRDAVKKELLVANSYEDAYALNETEMPGATAGKEKRDPARLGKLMDPSDPVRFASGKPYRFSGWEGAVTSQSKTIKVEVRDRTVLIARFQQR